MPPIYIHMKLMPGSYRTFGGGGNGGGGGGVDGGGGGDGGDGGGVDGGGGGDGGDGGGGKLCTYEQVFLMTTKFSLMGLGPSSQSTCCPMKLAVEVI